MSATVNITEEILEKVKCSECGGYLSFGPVYMKPSGAAICGQCKNPHENFSRNTQYEALATLINFPCNYQRFGCKQTIPFYEGTPPPHEEGCEFKQYICPVMESGKCEWLGRRCEILKHCQDNHKEKVLSNPCTLQHNITKFSLNTFLLHAYGHLFVLHTKVCITSGKIYHALRILGDPTLTSKFKYSLEIRNDELILSKPGHVAPEGFQGVQEDISIVIGINSLLEFLDDCYEGTIFKITVETLMDVGFKVSRVAGKRRVIKNFSPGQHISNRPIYPCTTDSFDFDDICYYD